MGFFDDIQASMNRGMASAGRAVDTQKIKMQMNDAAKRRQALAAQLGASLYDVTKDTPEFRLGREPLYDGIAAVDAERASLQAQLDELERQVQQAAQGCHHICMPLLRSAHGRERSVLFRLRQTYRRDQGCLCRSAAGRSPRCTYRRSRVPRVRRSCCRGRCFLHVVRQEAWRRRLCRVMRHMAGTKSYDDFVPLFLLCKTSMLALFVRASIQTC